MKKKPHKASIFSSFLLIFDFSNHVETLCLWNARRYNRCKLSRFTYKTSAPKIYSLFSFLVVFFTDKDLDLFRKRN